MKANQAGLRHDRSEFNVVFVHSALDDAGLTPHQFRIYCHLARRAGGSAAWPSVLGMADHCRMGHHTVRAALALLEEMNLIHRTVRPGRTDLYTITKRSQWKTAPLPKQEGVEKDVFCPNRKATPTQIGRPPLPNQEDEGNPRKGIQGRKSNFQCEIGRFTTPLNTLFRRRETTPWSTEELKKARSIVAREDWVAELSEIVTYYQSKGKTSEAKYLRHDLITLLNNWAGELDRARAWNAVSHNREPVLTQAVNGF